MAFSLIVQMADTDSGRYDVGVVGLERSCGEAQHRASQASCSTSLRHDPQPQIRAGMPGDELLRTQSLGELAELLRRRPRSIFIFGQTAAETDAIIDELLPHLAPERPF